MNIIRRSDTPSRRDIFADFFDNFFDSDLSPAAGRLAPAVDIVEGKDKYTVKADLPGLKQEDIKVELDDGVLKIYGERKSEREEKDDSKKYHYYERSYGSFERRFVLPKDTDGDKIDAKYENGVLTVDIPKTEAKKPKEIKVK
ncbi:MAG TPA: Hsp20/alpha crystallin family protein [Candidatus Goldiibacteriota bacterium]|nr:Hsp20/alpha crystallin family protein [Candidatus Goldiibacteriota bacterium]